MLHSKEMCSCNMQNAEYPYDGGKDGWREVCLWMELSLSLYTKRSRCGTKLTSNKQTNKHTEELKPNPSSNRSRCWGAPSLQMTWNPAAPVPAESDSTAQRTPAIQRSRHSSSPRQGKFKPLPGGHKASCPLPGGQPGLKPGSMILGPYSFLSTGYWVCT